MSDYYKLNEDKTISPCNLHEWSMQREQMRSDNTIHVAQTDVGDYWVSTVWLGLNHNWDEGDPLVFETMVFDVDGYDIYCDRYTTWDEAVAGHQKAIVWVNNGCKDDER